MRAVDSAAGLASKATIWRVITDADAGVFDAAVGRWLMSSLLAGLAARSRASAAGQDDPAELMPVRLDGKTIRGAKDDDGNQRMLTEPCRPVFMQSGPSTFIHRLPS